MAISPRASRWAQRAAPLLLLLACFAAACGPAQVGRLVIDNPDPDDPARPTFFDIGTLRHGTRTRLPVHFTNDGRGPVTLMHVDPACQCTVAERVRLVAQDGGILVEGDVRRDGNMLVVPAGGRMELVVGINTKSLLPNRDKLAVMRLRTSSPETPFITLEIHLMSESLFQVTPDALRLGEVPESYGGSARVEIMTGWPKSPARILEVVEATGAVQAQMTHVHVNGEDIWALVASLSPGLPRGAVREKVVLATTDREGHGDGGRLEITVWAMVGPDVGLSRRHLHFGVLPQGTSGTLELEVVARVPGLRLSVAGVEFGGPAAAHLSASFAPAPGRYVDVEGRCERWVLTLAADAALPPGPFQGTVTVLLDDEQYPCIEAPVAGRVH